MLTTDLIAQLQGRRKIHRERKRHPVLPMHHAVGQVSFASNDYLGLSHHPLVIAALQQGAQQYGVGSTSSQMVSGYSMAHQALEEELAAFLQRSKVLLFSSGYMANIAVVTALANRHDHIYIDRLSHASLLDAVRYSGAAMQRFPHNNMLYLQQRLCKTPQQVKLIISDTIFSMDGDCAPIAELALLAKASAAWLMLDDAHGLGVCGVNGQGCVAAGAFTEADVPIVTGTFGKAFGTAGAFVAGSEMLIEYLLQFARPATYSTALSPALVEATRMSLRLIQEEAWRRSQLRQLIHYFQHCAMQLGLPISLSDSPIQIIKIGSEKNVVQLGDALLQKGFLVGVMRPPTVPSGTSRLRISLTASHTQTQIEQLLETVKHLTKGMCTNESCHL